jgi:GGDEF domain-containing protein
MRGAGPPGPAAAPVGGCTFRWTVVVTVAVTAAVLVPQAMQTGAALLDSELAAPVVIAVWSLFLGVVSVVRTRGEERRWRLSLTGSLAVLVLGAVRWVVVFGTSDGGGQRYSVANLAHLVGVARLLIGVRTAQRGLRHQALHDPLTGLADRMLFDAEVVEAVDRQRAEGRPIALLFCDLDEFKAVNDSLGHAAGDELLRTAADAGSGLNDPEDLIRQADQAMYAVKQHHRYDRPRASPAPASGRREVRPSV